MIILNRRNAVVGWITWVIAKHVLKRKARAVVPGTVEGSRRPNKSAIAAIAAAARRPLVLAQQELGDDDDETTGES